MFHLPPWLLALAVLACAALLWLFAAARRRAARPAAFGSAPRPGTASEQDPERVRALLAGLVPAALARIAPDSLATGLPRGDITATLAEQWGVRTPGDLRATLAWLHRQGDRGTYRRISHIAIHEPAAQWPAAVQALGEEYDHEQLLAWVANLAAALPELHRSGLVHGEADLTRGIAAWDLARAVQLARLGYDASLIPTQDAWKAIDLAAAQFYDAHASWRETASGYVLGQAMMQGPGPALTLACETAQACLDDAASPWRRQGYSRRSPRPPAGRVFDRPAHPPAG